MSPLPDLPEWALWLVWTIPRSLLLAAWAFGFVVCLRHRPAAGASLAAFGFGGLAALDALALAWASAHLISLVTGTRPFDLPTYLGWPLTLLFGLLSEFAKIALVATAVIGTTRAWRAADRAVPDGAPNPTP